MGSHLQSTFRKLFSPLKKKLKIPIHTIFLSGPANVHAWPLNLIGFLNQKTGLIFPAAPLSVEISPIQSSPPALETDYHISSIIQLKTLLETTILNWW